MYYVYILFSPTKLKFYTGQTNNLEKRLTKHNNAQMPSTKFGMPWQLIYSIAVASRSEAVKLESKIKSRGAKRYLDDIGFKI